jgi:Tol biopolymer transport system component
LEALLVRFIEADLAGGPTPSVAELCADFPALAPALGERVSEYRRLLRELGGDQNGGALVASRYQLLGLLGRGGMGEVWRAHDTRLGRDVALKLVLTHLDRDPQRLARFEREARLLASLNHPYIASLHHFDLEGDRQFLVMELVEGPTLADRLAGGALPMDEALRIARQIAEALESAHEKGVVHRDLKPANVKVRDDETVKVLDFGLAKSLIAAAGDAESPSSRRDQATETLSGTLLGTAAYMAPEQATGKRVDQRADLWALGAVLFEMLTGRRPFPGDGLSETLVAVLEREPDWTLLPAGLPFGIETFLRRCLEKDPQRRVHHAADLRLALEGAFEPANGRPAPATVESPRVARWLAAAAALVAAVGIGLAAGRLWQRPPTAQPVRGATRLTLPLDSSHRLTGYTRDDGTAMPERPSLHSFALSPDGRRLVWTAAGADEISHLYVRSMDRPDARLIPGTEYAGSPFWSPDGNRVGFLVKPTGSFAIHRPAPECVLKRVSLESGEVRCIPVNGPISWPFGASWTEEDMILLPGKDGIYEVPLSGGDPVRKTTTPVDAYHTHPQILPGGVALLFNLDDGSAPRSDMPIMVESLATGDRRVLTQGSDARYLQPGFITFARSGRLMLAPFDLERLEMTGAPVVVLEDVMHAELAGMFTWSTGVAQYSISSAGTLAYVPGGVFPQERTQLVWVDTRNGGFAPIGSPARIHSPRLSPDGTKLAYVAGPFFRSEIWVHDLEHDVAMQLTSPAQLASNGMPLVGERSSPVWSHDGSEIAFVSYGDIHRLFVAPADGSGSAREVVTSHSGSMFGIAAASWSIDDVIAYLDGDPLSIWIVSAHDDREPERWLSSDSGILYPSFSPDGRWLAYTAGVNGRSEVLVRSFPDGQRTHRISSEGGFAPVWARDGSRLFFRNRADPASDLVVTLAVDVELGEELSRGKPRVLVSDSALWDTDPVGNYDVASDGHRLVSTRLLPEWATEKTPLTESVQRIEVALDWLDEVRSQSFGPRAR